MSWPTKEEYGYIEKRCPSFLGVSPEDYNIPRGWILDKEAETFEEDRDFINKVLPGIPVHPMGTVTIRGQKHEVWIFNREDEQLDSGQAIVQAIEKMAGKYDLASRTVAWVLLKQRCPSLLSNRPSEHTNPKMWLLYRHAPTYEDDRAFIEEHLGDRVSGCQSLGLRKEFDMFYNGELFGKHDIQSRTIAWNVLKNHCPSLLTPVHREGHAGGWALNNRERSFGKDREIIRRYLGDRTVTMNMDAICST